MRGDQHVFYTLLSAVILLSPVLSVENIFLLLIFLIAVFIGSLAPDADSADSAIMHGIPGGEGGIRILRRHTVLILPFFGYLIRYMIYFPLSVVLWIFTLGRVKPKHRGVLHSLSGIILISLVVTACLAGALYLLRAQEYFLPVITFGCGIFFGALMHLLEDSCTKGGVYWFYPISEKKLGGTMVSGSRRYLIITAILGAGAAAVYVNDFTDLFPPEMPFAPPVAVLLTSWAIILRLGCSEWS